MYFKEVFMHISKIFLEFEYYPANQYSYHFDSTTTGPNDTRYSLAITKYQRPYTQYFLRFSTTKGLINSADPNETDLVSQLLSIRMMIHKHISCTNEAYNDALIEFFYKYGFFSNPNNDLLNVSRDSINSFLDLLFYIVEIRKTLSSETGLTNKSCKYLLSIITNMLFLKINNYEFDITSFHLPYCMVRTDSRMYDSFDDIDAEIRKSKIMEIDANQLSEDEWEYYYAAKDIILNLQEYLEKHCSPEEVQITNFYRTHIIDGHFNLETNKSTKKTSIVFNGSDLTDFKKEIVDISNTVCNYFFSQAFKESPILLNSQLNRDAIEHNLKQNVYNLGDALLLSLLYFDPTSQEFKKCELDTCSNYFIASKNNTKKIYCCRAHARTAATKKFRELI